MTRSADFVFRNGREAAFFLKRRFLKGGSKVFHFCERFVWLSVLRIPIATKISGDFGYIFSFAFREYGLDTISRIRAAAKFDTTETW